MDWLTEYSTHHVVGQLRMGMRTKAHFEFACGFCCNFVRVNLCNAYKQKIQHHKLVWLGLHLFTSQSHFIFILSHTAATRLYCCTCTQYPQGPPLRNVKADHCNLVLRPAICRTAPTLLLLPLGIIYFSQVLISNRSLELVCHISQKPGFPVLWNHCLMLQVLWSLLPPCPSMFLQHATANK